MLNDVDPAQVSPGLLQVEPRSRGQVRVCSVGMRRASPAASVKRAIEGYENTRVTKWESEATEKAGGNQEDRQTKGTDVESGKRQE